MWIEPYGENGEVLPPYEHNAILLSDQARQMVATNMDPICLPSIIASWSLRGECVMPGVQLEMRTTFAQQCNKNYGYLNMRGIRMRQVVGLVCDLRDACLSQGNSDPREGQLFYNSTAGAKYLDAMTGEPMSGSGFFGIQGSLDTGWVAITEAEMRMMPHGVFDKLDPIAPYASCRAEQIIVGTRRWQAGKELCEKWNIDLSYEERAKRPPKRSLIFLLSEGANVPTVGERRLADETRAKGEAATLLTNCIDNLCRAAPKNGREHRWTETELGNQLEVDFYQYLPEGQDRVLKKLTIRTPGLTDNDCRECYVQVIALREDGSAGEVTYRWADNWRYGQGMHSVGLTQLVDEQTVEPVPVEEFVEIQKLVTDQAAKQVKRWQEG